jgi:asparagine synthase (glutamine-hydrolysing)
MCGIAGKVSSEGAVPTAVVEAMCTAQAHRGPDSRGIHASDGCCLGIQRLAIIDLQTGDQPIYNEDRTVAVVLNGEIYNYRELRDQLRRRGHSFSTQSDTEVIAHLYEEKGERLAEDLEGMFAFAVWDESRRRLVLGRDRVGKKPLFYSSAGGRLSFASELQALMQDPEIPREVDASAIDSYLAYAYVPAPWSIWRSVWKLPPAHTLVWEAGATEISRYWRLHYEPKADVSDAERVAELRELVAKAVRRRMISDVPLGAFLSGGVDSAIVVSEMARVSDRPVKTFSIGFEEEAYNELPGARRIAEQFSTEHHEYVVKPDAVNVAEKLVHHYGEPYGDSSAIPSYYLAELTRVHVTVALNGDGGDESFAGYLRHTANSATRGLDRIPLGLRRSVSRSTARLRPGPDRRGRWPYARRLLTSVDRSPAERYADHICVFNDAERRSLFLPDAEREIDHTQAERFLRGEWFTAPCDSRLDTVLSVDVNTYLPYDLLVKMDIATMANSLEARSPFLDRELMEFAARLPGRDKALLGRRKRILREAYRDRIPSETLSGPKRGFAVPLSAWFRGELREYTQELLLSRDSATGAYLDRDQIASMFQEHLAGDADRSGKLWTLLMLELWQRQIGATPLKPSGAALQVQAG